MTKTAFSIVSLGKLTSKIGSGATPRGGERSYKPQGIPLIRSMNVYDLRFEHEGLAFLDQHQAAELDHVTVQHGDVLLNITGASVARCCPLPRDLVGARVNQHVVILRPRQEVLDGRYLGYVLVAPQFKNLLLSLSHVGGTREALTKSGLERFQVPCPDLRIQRRIVYILGAYDDLIENNRRRIAILEEMARRLFEEWFVHFRFPGSDAVALVDSKLGPLPPQWALEPLRKVVDLLSGFAFKSGTFEDGGRYKLVTIKNILDGKFNPVCDSRISDLPRNMPQHCIMETGDICMSLTGNVGRVCVVRGDDLLLNQRVAKLRPKSSDLYPFVYCLTRSLSFQHRLINIANGVAQQNLSPIQTGGLPIIVPPPTLIQKFAHAVRPMLDLALRLTAASDNLVLQRTMALPRLVSGELPVEVAEQELEAAD